MGPHTPSFRLSVFMVMSVAGTLTPNAKSRTALFTSPQLLTCHSFYLYFLLKMEKVEKKVVKH